MFEETKFRLRRRTARRRLKAVLWALGDSEQEVALKLSLLGIYGIQSSPASCPVAKFLKGDQDNIYVAVTPSEIKIGAGKALRYETITVKPPRPVKEFIQSFDRDGRYLYPNLLLRSTWLPLDPS